MSEFKTGKKTHQLFSPVGGLWFVWVTKLTTDYNHIFNPDFMEVLDITFSRWAAPLHTSGSPTDTEIPHLNGFNF